MATKRKTTKRPKKPAKRKRGRPSKFSPAIARKILGGLSDGIPLTIICQPTNMPGVRTVYDWMESNPGFSADIARARDSGWDRIAHDCLKIADTTEVGETVTEKPDGVEIKRGDMLGHRRLRVETRLKLLAKWDPKRYGDKVTTEISGPDGKPIQSQTAHTVSEEMQEAILARTLEAARIAANVEPPASFRGKDRDE